jgi:uncharacterized protein
LLAQIPGPPRSPTRRRALSVAPAYVQGVVGDDAGGHDWWHAERVSRTALEIAKHEGADAELCVLIAVVHDVVDYKVVNDEHAATRRLRRWLVGCGVEDADIDQIVGIAGTLSFNGGGGPPMQSLEGAVVQDADRLDSLGAIGLARTLAFGGTIGRPLHEPGLSPRFGMTAQEYRSHLSTSINHIRERLLVVRDRLNTSYARDLAHTRETFVLDFLKRFEDEWHGRL